ncbi:MAG TPA: hypothetical protein VE988_27790 [Gemmataceae bacterium]|nr:hypothetical protein [Gemmataceae bacterium]
MPWTVAFNDIVAEDLEWFGLKGSRALFKALLAKLKEDPLAETKNMKTLRPNSFAQRELRINGKYRVLFNVNEAAHSVTVLTVGEKKGNKLLIRGKEFTGHHESHSPKQSESPP